MLHVSPSGGRSLSFGGSSGGKGISLPCGRCIGCRLERARQWAVRIVHESKMHAENSFLTLTYDDDHLPADRSLSVSHCQLFLKRLRAKLEPTRIRFFLCGEYGEQLGRPHYHAIVFGWFPSDAVLIKGTGDMSLWSSQLLSSTWGHGFASVGQVSFDSAAYVANYATKKITGPSADAHYRGRRPEYLLMSRRPGIGRAWFDKFSSDVFPCDEVIVNGVPCRPPRYYDNLLDVINPDMLLKLKMKREIAAAKLEDMLLPSGDVVSLPLSRNARRLEACEKVARAKFSLKRRDLEVA
ncbi:MAG: replication initiator protein [Microvirus sp.]|nr:MAG: replication initiator protein [Microvirus sp.]